MATSDHSSRMLMACIGDASRFRLVQALTDGARCVTDLAGEVGLSQSCTTRHLQALERRRVVYRARDGKRVMYRLCHEEPGLGPLLAWALSTDGVRAGMIPPGDRIVSAKSSMRPRRAVRRSPPARRGRNGDPGESAAGPAPTPVLQASERGIADPATANGSSAQVAPESQEPTRTARGDRYEIEDYLL